MESKMADTSQNENNWLQNCEEYFDSMIRLQETFTYKSPEDKRTILQDIGKIVLNNGEMAFQLEEPYQLAEKTVKLYDEALKFSEPAIVGSGINISALPGHVLTNWRNGGDSNPRPPQ